MPIKNNIEGGKIPKPKSFKQMGRELNKKVFKPISKGGDEALNAFGQVGAKLGEFTNEELLPAVKTIGIPVASGMVGLLGEELGGPMGAMVSEKLTNQLLTDNIPGQSKNKYVKLLGNALNTGIQGAMSGQVNPQDLMGLGDELLGNISQDTLGKPKQSIPKSIGYDDNNPYNDIMMQLLNSYSYQPPLQSSDKQPPIDNPNDDNDALYSNSELGEGADSITITSPPYQQREGSMQGLLGAGLFSKKVRPYSIGLRPDITPHEQQEINRLYNSYTTTNDHTLYTRLNFLVSHINQRMPDKNPWTIDELVGHSRGSQKVVPTNEGYGIKKKKKSKKVPKEIDISLYIEKIPHKRFTRAKNSSLEQLLEAQRINKENQSKKEVEELMKKQTAYLKSLGF